MPVFRRATQSPRRVNENRAAWPKTAIVKAIVRVGPTSTCPNDARCRPRVGQDAGRARRHLRFSRARVGGCPADALHDRHFWPARADFADTSTGGVWARVRSAYVRHAVWGGRGRLGASARSGAVLPQRGAESLGPLRPLVLPMPACRHGPAYRRGIHHRAPARFPPPGADPLCAVGPSGRFPAFGFRAYLPRYSLMYSIAIMPLVRA